MKKYRILGSFCAMFLIIIACRQEEKDTIGKSFVVDHIKDSTLDFIIKKFSLPCPDKLVPDSNSLIFYCSRTFDTTSLLHLQKSGNSIHGVFYEILPTYHRYANDYADQGDSLLFFEGYSFVIDSTVWGSVQEQAHKILQNKDSISKNDRYVDGKNFALYHNSINSKGNSGNEEVYEKFDRFLKDSFLEKFIQARKPIMHKKTK